MALYNIYAGLGGSFGGATYQYTSDFDNREEADTVAWEKACEIYESYEGYHGLLDYGDAIKEYCEDNDLDEVNLNENDYEEINEIYGSYRESWMEYYAILTEEDSEVSKDELDVL